MNHYVPLQGENGWSVAYRNHRNEFVSVMECPSLDTAYQECATLTLHEVKQAIAIGAPVKPIDRRF